jgi:hypothetical protein
LALRLGLAGLAAAFLVAPTGASGTVTIGSNLGREPTGNASCSPCTFTFGVASLSPAALAPGGLVSPVNGTVVTWRIRVGQDNSLVNFRVIKRLGGGLGTGAGTSAPVRPPVNMTSVHPTALPIAIGDAIGIDCCSEEAYYLVEDTGTTDAWVPPLVDGGPPQPVLGVSPVAAELAVNADIEPTSAFTILKSKPRKGGKVQITANLPNPGTLAASDKRAKLAAAAGKGKKPRILKRASVTVSAPGRAVLVVQATKTARSLLADKGRLKAKLKLAFTPNGGIASTQVRRVKLKR